MNSKLFLPLGILALCAVPAQAALIWTVGKNDDAWPLAGVGGGAEANFWQENGAVNALPGSPNSPQVDSQSDNDYYFAGTYTTTIAANGSYTPVGVVAANEPGAERAFAGADLELRYHFNVPTSLPASQLMAVSFDALNLHIDAATVPDPRFGVEVYFNNKLVGAQVIVRPADVVNPGTLYTTAPFTLASVGAVTGPGADNIVSLKGVSYNAAGGGNWMGVDSVQLNSVPEPGTSAMAFLAGLGVLGHLSRRRSQA
jgi:MYXO-CTERM domain-containing protein